MMVSPELLRAYPFFGGLSEEQLVNLACMADEVTLEAGSYVFKDGQELANLYLVHEGQIALTLDLPEVGSRSIIAIPNAHTREVVLSTINAGAILAWSALIPPYHATSNGKATQRCRLIAFDARKLRAAFEDDPRFGYTMLIKVVQITRERIQDLHYESLACEGASATTMFMVK